MPIGLALIVYKLMSLLTSKANKIMPIGLAIDSLQASVCVDIDSLRDRALWSGIDSSQECVGF